MIVFVVVFAICVLVWVFFCDEQIRQLNEEAAECHRHEEEADRPRTSVHHKFKLPDQEMAEIR